MFGLCDCNNFYVSCERVFDPSLSGRPVVVLSSNDGCVISRSNEAKEIGIKMGQPLFQAQELINKYKVAVFSCNHQLYGDMSDRVMSTLKSMLPKIEIYSIDEAFIDFEGFDISSLDKLSREIAKKIKRDTGIPVSIGIAQTKTLAKVASKLCKKYPKLDGGCLMYRSQDIEKVLKNYAIEDVWGIGRRYTKMLKSYDIHTAYEFSQCSSAWVRSVMSITGLRTWKELNGEQCIEFEDTLPDKQSICVSRSFASEINDYESLRSSLSVFVGIAAEKLRRQNCCTSQMQVFISTNRHKLGVKQQNDCRIAIFDVATDSTIELTKQASAILKTIFQPGVTYKKAGVILSSFISKQLVQTSLFDTTDRPKHTRLMHAIDSINSHFGRNSVSVATQDLDSVKISRNHLSPSYTTNWNDILVVKV